MSWGVLGVCGLVGGIWCTIRTAGWFWRNRFKSPTGIRYVWDVIIVVIIRKICVASMVASHAGTCRFLVLRDRHHKFMKHKHLYSCGQRIIQSECGEWCVSFRSDKKHVVDVSVLFDNYCLCETLFWYIYCEIMMKSPQTPNGTSFSVPHRGLAPYEG